jgi:hypothetical protein
MRVNRANRYRVLFAMRPDKNARQNFVVCFWAFAVRPRVSRSACMYWEGFDSQRTPHQGFFTNRWVFTARGR